MKLRNQPYAPKLAGEEKKIVELRYKRENYSDVKFSRKINRRISKNK
jgi:hypothetical protein